MHDLEQLKSQIIDSGSITASDVAKLRKIVYTDGKVNQAEAEFLFGLRKELFDFGNLKDWNKFFIEAICNYILDDERSPEAIDDLEAQWLIEQIGEDSIIDDVERKLLKELRKRAKRFPANLGEIQNHTSIARDLGRKILLLLCGNTKYMRSLEFGVDRSGQRKSDPFHVKTIPSGGDDDDDHN